ncbi:VOC family protein [Georgenia sp. Z1491]|uniref:VOC family protein n=1 Tax=Georgenia sp. Z1491 TaxID=3416707 RepID=UPI003CEEB17A
MAVRSGFPILTSDAIEPLVAFYEAAFEATKTYRYPGEDGRDVYVALDVGGMQLGIGVSTELPPPDRRTELWFYVDDVDESYRRAIDAGAGDEGAPSDMPWGERVAHVRDPDGLVIHLGAQTAPA